MSVMYEVTGYDRKSGRLAAFYDVPFRRLASVRKVAGVSALDDGLGAYPLDRDQVSAIARLLEARIENQDLDYFLEAYDEGSDRRSPGADGSPSPRRMC
jgi:hypothetical protein